MKSYKILCLAIASVLIYSLSSCNDSESKVSVNTDTSAPVSTNNPFDSDANSTDDFEDELIVDENGYNQLGVLNDTDGEYSLPASDFELNSFSVDNEYDYNGEEISFEFKVKASENPDAFTIAILCNDRLIPFSVDGASEVMSANINGLSTDKTYIISFRPYGKKGEQVAIKPLLITNTRYPSFFRDFNRPHPFQAYPWLSDTTYVNMNVNGAEEAEPITQIYDVIPLEEIIAEYYKEPLIIIDEEGNEILVNRFEYEYVTAFIDMNGEPTDDNILLANDGENIRFDYVLSGKPRKEFIIYCWSNEGFLPIFDGEYQTKLYLDDFEQEIKIPVTISLDDYPNIETMSFLLFYDSNNTGIIDNYIKDTFAIYDEKTMQELNDWLETIE